MAPPIEKIITSLNGDEFFVDMEDVSLHRIEQLVNLG